MNTNTKAPANAVRPFGMRDKLGYAMGDMGCGFSFQLVSTFMQLFYMQYIGIPETAYGIIIILSKVFDAINDVVIGNLVDTKKIGKKSKAEEIVLPQGAIVLPGFIDQHIHGAGGSDGMDGTVEDIAVIAKTVATEGTTTFLVTTMTQSKENITKAMQAVKD